MTTYEVAEAFTRSELRDVIAAARERGITIWQLIHDAVLDDVAR